MGASETPIIPAMAYDGFETFRKKARVLERGVSVNQSATPPGQAMLRTSGTARHTTQQLNFAMQWSKKVFSSQDMRNS